MDVEYGVVPPPVDDLENPEQFGSNDFGGTSARQFLEIIPGIKISLEGTRSANSFNSFSDYLRSISTEKNEIYLRQVAESDGFDVDYCPDDEGIGWCGTINPVNLTEYFLTETGIPLAEAALKEYNKENNAQFEFLKVEKANAQGVCGMKYYITFQAKDTSAADGPTKSFQAEVLEGIPKPGKCPIEVIYCRLKGAPK